MIDFVEGTPGIPGTWKGVREGSRKTAIVTCLKCSHLLSLRGNSVTDTGAVIDNVKCSTPECTFNDEIRLVGWSTSKECGGGT